MERHSCNASPEDDTRIMHFEGFEHNVVFRGSGSTERASMTLVARETDLWYLGHGAVEDLVLSDLFFMNIVTVGGWCSVYL